MVQTIRRIGRSKWWIHVILIAVGFIMSYPVLWMIFGAFKPTNEIFTNPSFFPTHWILSNFTVGWTAIPGPSFGRYILNSLFISLMVVIGTVISSSLAAFAFARLQFRLKGLLFGVMMVTMMLPAQVTLIPQYVMFHAIGWVNTYYPLIVPAFFGNAFFIFMMIQFMRGIPVDLDDAARIDGCTPFQFYWKILLPLITPALITAAIFSFIWSWDDFFSQLVYLNGSNLLTVPLALRAFMNQTGQQQWGPMFAMSTISLAPMFAIFLVFQRYIVNGIATAGLKG